jgi:bacteriocin biosynthesis cyclodehydratase domain-containing protein
VNYADLALVGFKSHVRAKAIPAEAVYVVSQRGLTALSGSAIELLAPLLDGTRTRAQLTSEVSAFLSAGEVQQVLDRLSGAGLIDFVQPSATGPGDRGDERTRAYWDLAGIAPDVAASALAGSSVEITTIGGGDHEAIAAACRGSGLTVREEGGSSAALSIVVCADYLDPDLDAVNADHLATRRPWLLAKSDGPSLWTGPIFQPGCGPCWACLAKRLAGNRRGEYLMRRLLGTDRPTEPSLPASRALGAQVIALEAMKWLAGLRYEGQQDIYVMDTVTLQGQHHRVARRPQCRSCGNRELVSTRTRRPVKTLVREIAEGEGNGQRAVRLDDMLGRYGHLVDPVTGIIGEIRRDPNSPEFLPAYLSGRNRAMTEDSMTALRAGLRASSGGKGVTELEAKVGALCEAVERYCGTLDGDELRISGSYRGLGDQAVHPNACQLFDERQFAERARWNAGCLPFHSIPEPFDSDAVTDWTPVWSLLDGSRRLLPTAMLYFKPDTRSCSASVRADSNGNAAGGSPEDAIMQGFFELVERDAVALWWYNRTRHAEVCLDSFGDPWAAGLPEVYGRLGREVWVLDVTSDLGIPAMAAVSRRTDKPSEDIVLGFGAHVDPHIALRRALTELSQSLPAVVAARADGGGYHVAEPHLMSWWSRATVRNQPYLRPDSGQVPRTAASYHYIPDRKLDISRICTVAGDAGLDLLILDQTRPDINMPVVKVVVPGLRHFWPRFAPGRLFEVPVRLGRLTKPTAYDRLNPIPLFL